MVHLAGDLVQPAVAQHPAVLGDGAPEVLEAVLRFTQIVVRRRELVVQSSVLLAREAAHQRVIVVELEVRLQRVHR